MNTIVLYKSKYGSTKAYAEWIAEELGCKAKDSKGVKAEDLLGFDTIIYGGGLYAEIIAGASLITKNIEKLKDKKLIIYTTGITPLNVREYYDHEVLDKNIKPEIREYIKVFNFMGRMVLSELSAPHRAALKMLKKIMSGRENPTDLEKMLIELCDADGDFTDRAQIKELVEYAKN